MLIQVRSVFVLSGKLASTRLGVDPGRCCLLGLLSLFPLSGGISPDGGNGKRITGPPATRSPPFFTGGWALCLADGKNQWLVYRASHFLIRAGRVPYWGKHTTALF